MTSSTRATALLVATAVAVLAFATAAVFRGVLVWLERRDERPVVTSRHVRRARARAVELIAWAFSALVRWYRTEFTGLKLGLTGEVVALAVAVLIGAAQ